MAEKVKEGFRRATPPAAPVFGQLKLVNCMVTELYLNKVVF